MVQQVSDLAKKFLNELSELKNGYGSDVESINNNIKDISKLNDGARREAQNNLWKDYRDRYRDRVLSYMDKLNNNIDRLKREKMKIKYPFLSDSGTSIEAALNRNFGSSEINNAYQFLQAKHSPEEIYQAIEEAKILERYEFLSVVKSEMTSINLNEKYSNMDGEVKQRISDMFDDTKLFEYDRKLEELITIKRDAIDFQNLLVHSTEMPKQNTFDQWKKDVQLMQS